MSQILSLTGSVHIRDETGFNKFMSSCVPKWRGILHKYESSLNPVEMAMSEAISKNIVTVHIHEYTRESSIAPQWIVEQKATEAFSHMFGEVF